MTRTFFSRSEPSRATRSCVTRLLGGLCLLIAATGGAAEPQLTADQLVLVVNENVPAGEELATYYARARNVPEGRIVALDLPTGDRMSREDYETRLARPLREFLEEAQLKEQVTCVVTFFGVPLAVGERTLTARERDERAAVDRLAASTVERLEPIVEDAEEVVTGLGYAPPRPADSPAEASELDKLLGRLEGVQRFANARLRQLDPQQAASLRQQFESLGQRLQEPLRPSQDAPEVDPDLLSQQDRPEAREALRDAASAGPLPGLANVLRQHRQMLSTQQSDASVDSELSLLWQPAAPAAMWVANPLASPGTAPGPAAALMTCRLDSVSPQAVRDLIADSILAEKEGLSGSILVDSRGLDPETAESKDAGYAQFDDGLRRLARRLERESAFPVVHDDEPAVFAPPGHEDVAVYVGWYSLAKYVDAFDFKRGAVAYHVASFELRSLRDPSKSGWVKSLLEDGVVATLGPVSEPYLVAFPPPEQFVPALLEGDRTLAEVYWRTLPVTSWKMALIGDPLYRPFGVDAQ